MKKTLIIGGTTLALLGVGYSAGVGYYAEKFQANTKFGAIDISNMTLAQAQEAIEASINQTEITLTENGKEIGRIALGSLEKQVNTQEVLQATYESQDPQTWILGFFGTTAYENALLNNIQINSDSLTAAINQLGIQNEGRIAAKDATIEYANGKGYFVQPESAGNQVDLELLKQRITESLQTGVTNIDINTAYITPKIKSDDEKITQIMQEIERIASTKLTIQIAGVDNPISRETIMEWIYFDESNHVVVDQTVVAEYLKTFNEQYATFNKPRQFQSTLQGTVTVEPGTLGWSIDRDAESAQIIQDLQAGGEIKREANIVGTGYGSGDDVGSSYVEVDIANQMMFIYIDGEQVLSTPIVTGRVGSLTIPGAYAVWNKEENTVLKGTRAQTGTDYEQPVDFWLPFDDTGQGIHDANWQGSFGGDAYLTAGSQGCINVPPGVMPQVFQYVQAGMPVIIF